MKVLIPIFLITLTMVVMGQNPDPPAFNLKWKFSTPASIHASPVQANDHIIFGSGDGNVYCLDADSGNEEWRFTTDGPVHSTGTIDGGTFLCTSEDGFLYALEVQSGQLKWKFQTKGEKFKDMWDYYLSSPLVHESIVYFGSGDGNFYAISMDNGQLEWKFETQDIIHFTPLIWEDFVYFGGFDGFMYSLNHRNGEVNWKFKTIGDTYFPVGANPKGGLIHDGGVIWGSRDYNIYALDALKGSGRWNMKERNSWVIASPVEDQGNIYFGTSDSHAFYSMRADDGYINWKIQINNRIFGSAAIDDQILYFGAMNGKLYAVDKSNGHVLSTFQTDGSKTNYSQIYKSDDHFSEEFIQLAQQDFVAAEQKLETLGPIYNTPLLFQSVILFGSGDGSMYAVEIR